MRHNEDVPKCTSWLGHRFEARYTKGPANVTGVHKFESASESFLAGIVEAHRQVTYEGDICVRCGHQVDRRETTPNL